jgi:hypothetical protein
MAAVTLGKAASIELSKDLFLANVGNRPRRLGRRPLSAISSVLARQRPAARQTELDVFLASTLAVPAAPAYAVLATIHDVTFRWAARPPLRYCPAPRRLNYSRSRHAGFPARSRRAGVGFRNMPR